MNTVNLTSIPLRKQTITVWERTGSNDFGVPIFSDPVEIKCRWDNMAELAASPMREEERILATFYPTHVLQQGDYVYLGSMESIDVLNRIDPTNLEGALAVRKFDTIGDFKGVRFLLMGYAG